YMVYDKRDRLVYTQDANMRSKNWWHTTLYDNLNRPIQTAMLTSPGYDRATLQSLVNGISDGATTVNTSVEITSGITADLSVSQWQTGVNYQASNSVTINDGFVSNDNAEYTVEIVAGTGTPASVQQTANTYPVPSGATLVALTYTHYDNYNWTSKQYKTAYNSKLSQGNSTYSEPLPTTTNTAVQGLVTGTRVRVLEDAGDLSKGKWLEAASFYDSKGRVVQVQATNYKGGEDALTSLYDFTGKVLSTYQMHSNASAGINNQSILTVMDYDHAGRVTQVRKTINDDLSKTRVIAQNSYDALGQLKTKQLGQKTDETGTPLAGQYLETQDYAYNIRGWLKGINWDGYGTANSKTGAKTNRWFAFDLSYDWGYEQNQYNGNIAGMRWQTGYDNANRLLYGDFKEYRSGWNNTANIDFSMKMGDGQNHASAYDENGNIKAMFQVGLKGTASTPIDNLGYSYNSLSNKLAAVTDAVTGDNKLGDFTDKNTTGDDYAYDDNGNLTIDKNKNIQSISYNHLNLPYQVTVKNDDGTAKGTITYIYDATGNKLEKRTSELAASSNQQQGKQT
ncbi:MAG: hypothetical protein J0I41_24440, partial [Filimonas sp.]|nr:hypothetical protein [Filimonas sp.]